MSPTPPPSQRFTGRVDDYVRGRPGYPEPLFDRLVDVARLGDGSVVADIGAGTGLSSEPFLRRGLTVFAVEPNAEMRDACRARLGSDSRLRIVDGSAESTGLESESADLVFAAQAFHWFEVDAARRELRRILRLGGTAALAWNARRDSGTPFAVEYEELLLRHGIDYFVVGHCGVDAAQLHRFFGGDFERERFENVQTVDRAGLRARLLSSSYVPAAGQSGHDEMLAALDRLFDRHAEGGAVTLSYDVDLFRGPLAAG